MELESIHLRIPGPTGWLRGKRHLMPRLRTLSLISQTYMVEKNQFHMFFGTHTHRVIKCYKINRIQHFNSGTLLVGKVFELGLSGYGEREHGASEHHKRNIR